MTAVETAEADAQEAHRRFDPPLGVADGAFGALLLGTLVCFLNWSSAIRVNSDDWLLAPRGNSVGDYFLPYEQNLSAIPIAVYHAWLSIFGFSHYWPLRFTGIGSHLAIAIILYLIIRPRLGPAAALLAGTVILWYPGVYLIPSVFNHWFALAASLVCAWALTRDGIAFDVAASAALAVALCSSGVGVAGAVGAVAYVALTRAPLRRWLAVGIPMALWGVWRITLADYHQRGTPPRVPAAPGAPQASVAAEHDFALMARYVRDGVVNSFQLVTGHNHLVAEALAVLFFALGAWRLREGTRAAAHQLAWTAAMVAWWVGLAYERGSVGTLTGAGPGTFRYRLVAVGFIAIALVPSRMSSSTRRRATGALAVGGAVVASALLIVANGPATLNRARDQEPWYRSSQMKMIAANLGPKVVADEQAIWIDPFTLLTAREYRKLTARYGAPRGTMPAQPDAAIVQIGYIRPLQQPPSAKPCATLREPLQVTPDPSTWHRFNPMTMVTLRAGSTDVEVDVRRFQDAWTTIGRIKAGESALLRLPDLLSRTPWTVRAPGACKIGP